MSQDIQEFIGFANFTKNSIGGIIILSFTQIQLHSKMFNEYQSGGQTID
jgi:hypothetical protein